MAERPSLTGSYLELFEGAQSEAKRLGAPVAGLEHLALLFARREAELVDGVFGSGAADRILDRPRVLKTGDGPALDELLASASEEQDSYGAIIAKLAAWLTIESPDEPAAAAEPAATVRATASAADRSGDDAGPTGSASEASTSPSAAGVVERSFPRTARFLTLVAPDDGIQGREQVIDDLVSLVGRATPRPVLVAGPEGCGRTSLLAGLAGRLQQPGYDGPLAGSHVVRLRPERLLSGDAGLVIRQAAEDAGKAEEPFVLTVDDLELVLGFGAKGRMDGRALLSLRAVIQEATLPLILLVDRAFVSRLAAYDDEFVGELTTVDLEPPERSVLEQISSEHATRLAEHHRVTIPEVIVRLSMAPKGRADLVAHPALLIERLDGACARAALRPGRTVAEADLGLGADPTVAPPDPARLGDLLRERVVGQDAAVDQLAERLALTRARLDLRPERPDGVFLFVGPTGVGKTELAKATAAALHGDDAGLIRLDMSEYAQEWSISQLIGPPPGYVGSTEPESWLTTKVRQQPQTVILLDEIEKAHPRVWNTFLQVFDVGRLTDSQGREADFGATVIILTSNLGAEAYATPGVGFRAEADPTADDRRMLEKVRAAMAPELINRLDGIVPFRPLAVTTIRQIAQNELDATQERLGERGYRLGYGPEVLDLLATSGYSPEYGARHLQRNIERLFLQPLAAATDRDLHAVVVDGTIRWVPAPGR